MPLEDLKKSNHVEVAEHASARNKDNEVAFSWWVPCVLKKREAMISQVTSRTRKTSHKYGIEVPTSLKYAAKIGSRNKNTFWRDATAKQMSVIGVAFDALETGQISPAGLKRTSSYTTMLKWILLTGIDGC